MYFRIVNYALKNNTLTRISRPIQKRNLVSQIPSYSFKIQDTDDFNDRVINSDKPVIVDFFATWCGPCKMLGPRIESVVDEMKGKVLLAKVDIDDNPDLAMDHKVSAVPVLLVFNKGKPGERIIGVQDADILRTFVTKAIGEN